MADAVPTHRLSPRAPRGRPRGGVGAGRGADGRWLAPPRDSAADGGDGRALTLTDRSGSRARACSHSPPRLRGEPAPDDRRDRAVLSPRRLVAVGACSDRTRALLRRGGG